MTIKRYLQGTTPTEIAETDILQFAGSAFDETVDVNEYNDTTHVKTSIGGNKSSANTPRNNKFISQDGGTAGVSQVQVDGGATEDLDELTDGDACLNINITNESNITIESAELYSYDGATPATAEPNLSFKAAEIGDTNFTDAEGSGSPLSLADKSTPATEHDYYIVLSVSPETTGLKDYKIRYEAIVS